MARELVQLGDLILIAANNAFCPLPFIEETAHFSKAVQLYQSAVLIHCVAHNSGEAESVDGHEVGGGDLDFEELGGLLGERSGTLFKTALDLRISSSNSMEIFETVFRH
jgi:hypothetical protein